MRPSRFVHPYSIGTKHSEFLKFKSDKETAILLSRPGSSAAQRVKLCKTDVYVKRRMNLLIKGARKQFIWPDICKP